MMDVPDVSEFLCLQEQPCSEEDFYFTRERTLALIHMYKTYKPQVNTGQIKTMKKLWEIIAKEMSNLFKITIVPAKCENRFKVLERNYKKTIDNNNKSGRGRKQFEYENEFNDLYRNKVNMKPVILLSSNETILPSENKENNQFLTPVEASETNTTINQGTESEVIISIPDPGPSREKVVSVQKKRPRYCESYKKRNDILMQLKNDLKNYYAEKLKIEKEKLQLRQENLEERKKRRRLLESQLDVEKE